MPGTEYAGGAAAPSRPATLVPMTLPQRLARVLPLALAGLLTIWATSLDNEASCRGLGECLGDAFADIAVLVVVVLLVPAALRLLGVPRVLLHWALLVGAASFAWGAADAALHAVDVDRDHDAVMPLPLVLVVALVAGTVASYGAGPGGPLRWRIALPATLVAVTLAMSAAGQVLDERRMAVRLADAPVTLYAPTIGGAGPSHASRSADGVSLSYSGVEVDGRHAYLRVELVPAPEGSLCEELLTYADATCVEDATTMRNDSGTLSDVAVVRGDTALVAQYDREELAPEIVLAALRDAPGASADELVD